MRSGRREIPRSISSSPGKRSRCGTGDAWLWTKTGVRLSEVPDVVRRTLQSSQYGTWVIDDVDLYESPDRVWYAIEVEDPQSEREATVRILEDGTLL